MMDQAAVDALVYWAGAFFLGGFRALGVNMGQDFAVGELLLEFINHQQPPIRVELVLHGLERHALLGRDLELCAGGGG